MKKSTDNFYLKCKEQFLSLAPKGGAVFDKIKAKMEVGERKFHTFQRLVASLELYESVKGESLSAKPCLFFSWLYHNLEFSTTAERNSEANEVQFLRDNLILHLPEVIENEVLALLKECKNNKHSTSVISDLDLSIFGAPKKDYLDYVSKIEEEFKHIPEKVFNQGRLLMVQNLLNRYYIYNDESFHSKFEKQARINLNLELDRRLEQYNFCFPFKD